MNVEIEKVMIVEGKRDKEKVKEVISEGVTMIWRNGRMSTWKLEELVEDLFGKEV
ncbi:hypothetical protein [Bacillus sp. WP8]|uniref:hypothetical protein n=1 Tax=Bacillus sp. WP8 TaxID=756828 RepID=UPI0016428BE0|nr:hypothetical protein [Bacillus sp. WP8]